MSGFRITTIYAFLTTNRDGDEAVVAIHHAGSWWPLVCADEARINSYWPKAEEIAKLTGLPITLAKFSVRENVEEIKP